MWPSGLLGVEGAETGIWHFFASSSFCVSFPRAHLEQGTAGVGTLSGELGSLLAQEAGKVSDSERAVGSSQGN